MKRVKYFMKRAILHMGFFISIVVLLSGCTRTTVNDLSSQNIYVLIAKWGMESGVSDFNYPDGIATDSFGNFYVADKFNNCIKKYSSNGTYLLSWGSLGNSPSQFVYPYAIAVDANNYIYVIDGKPKISKFDSNGNLVTWWNASTIPGGEFNDALGIAVDNYGNVFVADTFNFRIIKFKKINETNYIYLTQWSGINYPVGIVVADNGFVYVSENGAGKIKKYQKIDETTYNLTATWGSIGSSDGQFNNPCGIELDKNGNILIADTGNNRIQKFDINGNFITKWGVQGLYDNQFWSPNDIAVDINNDVVVLDQNKVQKFRYQ